MTIQWRARTIAIFAATVLVAGLLSACTGGASTPDEERVAQTFLDAVGSRDTARAAALTTSPAVAARALRADLNGLGAGSTGRLTATAHHTSGNSSTVDFTAKWTIPGATAPWRYTGHVRVVRVKGSWQVRWAPADLHPSLTASTHLQLARTQPARAALQDSDGKALFAPTPVVEIGIEPKLVANLPRLARTLAAVPQLQSTAAEITSAVKAANPTDFVPVIILRRSIYEQVRARIHDLAGTVFRSSTSLLGPSATFGQPLLGQVGPATAQVIAGSRGRIGTGDETGLGGLQQALDPVLSGTDALTVVAAGRDGTSEMRLATVRAVRAGRPVRLTLNRRTQQAAEHALRGIDQAASIVAVRRSTGQVLADANSTAATYDLGLAGAIPAGSTFKIATWAAAFTTDPKLTPATRVACPASTTVDGRRFVNENEFSYPPIPISAAFAYSCNTSAIRAALALPSDSLAAAARRLGLGATWKLPVNSFSGSLPQPAGSTEKAADAIGQGRVQVSPLLMALMAGAATSGKAYRPALLADAAPSLIDSLPARLTSRMNALMTATVRLPGGTGHALHTLRDVQGKTGTAEYGNATPPRSHAWFAGVQGDVAFAVFVYDGASAGVRPANVSRTFLEALPQN